MKKNNKKILFYTGISRAFRTTSIANLHEIAQKWPIILLSEKLDPETERIINDKSLFPGIEEIIQVSNETGEKTKLFAQNKYLHKLAKSVIDKHKPSMVILSTDTCLLDFYLIRFAKKFGAKNIILNSDLRLSTAKEMSKRTDLTHAHFAVPLVVPLSLRLLLVRIRKYCGYFLYNWILPISVGQMPFLGSSSRVLYSMPGARTDYRIVCSKQDYSLSLKEGIPKEKLLILEHPLRRKNAEIFLRKIYGLEKENKNLSNAKKLTVLYPEEDYGFKRKDGSLISKIEMQEKRVEIVSLITKTLSDWNIFIKPHPATQNTEELKKIFESISPTVTFVKPTEPLDKYIEMSNVIVGLPPSSSAIFTANLQCSKKPIISLDFPPQEIFGDCYRDFDGVEYVEEKENFIGILELIRDNKYLKKNKNNLETQGFSDTNEVLEYLFKDKNYDNHICCS